MKTFVISMLVILTSAATQSHADEKSEVMKKREAEQANLAAIGPAVDLTAKENLVKFIPCQSENECLRALQESEDSTVAAAAEGKGTMVAEFVELAQNLTLLPR